MMERSHFKARRRRWGMACGLTALVVGLGLGPGVQAGAMFQQGQLAGDDDTAAMALWLAADDVLAVRTLSWGGGLAITTGAPVPGGGFAPVLALFDAAGDLLQLAHGSSNTCGAGAGKPDARLGFCWDAGLTVALLAGHYTLVLSQDGNHPGATLAQAYSQAGQPHYTAAFLPGQPDASFIDVTGNARSHHWALNAVADALQVPEPGSAALVGLALALLRARQAAARAIGHRARRKAAADGA